MCISRPEQPFAARGGGQSIRDQFHNIFSIYLIHVSLHLLCACLTFTCGKTVGQQRARPALPANRQTFQHVWSCMRGHFASIVRIDVVQDPDDDNMAQIRSWSLSHDGLAKFPKRIVLQLLEVGTIPYYSGPAAAP